MTHDHRGMNFSLTLSSEEAKLAARHEIAYLAGNWSPGLVSPEEALDVLSHEFI